jgi:branched-chain amino acid transport system substrate-binding protein
MQRRSVIKAAAGASLLQLAPPFIIPARSADTVRIGLDNPLTGTYAAVGKNELIGCELAADQVLVKALESGEQQSLPRASVADELRRRLAAAGAPDS